MRLLQCPRTGSPLVLEDADLVAVDDPMKGRYPVAEGIPLLLLAAPGRAAIMEAFQSQSVTYYNRNYVASGNAARQARQRLVVDLLKRCARPGASVLEAGAGPAVLGSDILGLTSRYVALDVSLHNLLAGRQRLGALDGIVGDLIALPFKAETFDIVLAIGCLEYVPELPLAITELVRVTAPGGSIIATFANAESPSRQWEERVAYPLIAAARRSKADTRPVYPRWLHRRSAIEQQFRARGADVTSVCFYGSAFAGYPLTRSTSIRRVDQALATRFTSARERSAEFLVHAKRMA